MMFEMAKALLCVVPWLCSLVSMDTEPTVLRLRTPPRRALATMSVRKPVVAEPCHRAFCPLPGETAERIVRFSYVPEILRTPEEL